MTDRLAVDIGGTFVDAIRFDRETGDIALEKASTTPDDPTIGVRNSIDKVGADLGQTETFVHGTTLGINAFLEREGATTGIITNQGFRDVFEIGRYDRPKEDMYTIPYEKPETLVKRRRRVGVPGRIDADGEVVEPLDEEAVRDAARRLVEDRNVESIAVCFLHAYRNPVHERRAAEIIRESVPGISVSVSTDITGEYREYERTSTTVLDAYIKPIFESYVDQLDDALASDGFDGPFFITRSGGGALTAEAAKTAPVHTILSGPAGGLIGSSSVGDVTGRKDLIAVDMGGTSLDACVVEDGNPSVEYEASLEYLPIMIPVYDIRTIGAGGGSIAWLDGDILKVGPKSAGADPGPICYGQGGTEPTVTDAAVALGYLDPDAFLGGEMDLDADGAREGIRTSIAEPLDSSVLEVSRGVFDVTLANTVGAIREITVEKGLDPRDFAMVGYGGAGPMFVPLLARELDVPEVVVPRAPSVFSAWGMLMADVVYDFSQTHIAILDDVAFEDLDGEFAALEEEAEAALEDEGFGQDERHTERSVEMRYRGQEHAVEVPADGVGSIDELAARFEAQHRDRYGHAMDDPAEAVHVRVRGVGENDKPRIEETGDGTGDPFVGTREAYCFATRDVVEFDVYERGGLAPDDRVEGPAIIREPTTTLVFHADQAAWLDEFGHVVVTGGSE